MEIIYVFINAFLNLFMIFMHLMPFGIFDSMSLVVDIYSNKLFLLFLFIISFILGFIYLVYIIELLNIHVDEKNLEGVNLSEEEAKKSPTFLSELLNFIFGKSNFGTFWPILRNYISQTRLKIIPIIIIMLILYIPLTPNNRGYNTVGEFFNANYDIIFYAAGIDDGSLSDEDIDRRLQYAENGLNATRNDELQFRDTSILLKEIPESTLNNEALNNELNNQIRLYENVYDEESFQTEKERITTELETLENKLIELENQKDLSTQKNEIADYIEQINLVQDDIANLETYQEEIDFTYNNLNYLVETEDINNQIKDIYSNQTLSSIKINTLENNIDVINGNIDTEDIFNEYNNAINVLTEIKNNNGVITDDIQEEIDNNTLNNYISPFSEIQLLGNNIDYDDFTNIDERINLLEAAQNRIGQGALNEIQDDLLNENEELFSLEEKYDILSNIDSDNNTRLENVITNNSEEISLLYDNRENLTNAEEERLNALLLLQYKLIERQDDVNPLDSSVTLLGNRIEYKGLNILSGIGIFVTIISYLFNFIYYSLIVFLAGWKNMLILYLSLISGIMNRIDKFVEGTKFNEGMNKHIQKIKSNIFPDGEDREYTWFEEHKNERETYIIIWIEFFVRLAVIYWFFNL